MLGYFCSWGPHWVRGLRPKSWILAWRSAIGQRQPGTQGSVRTTPCVSCTTEFNANKEENFLCCMVKYLTACEGGTTRVKSSLSCTTSFKTFQLIKLLTENTRKVLGYLKQECGARLFCLIRNGSSRAWCSGALLNELFSKF